MTSIVINYINNHKLILSSDVIAKSAITNKVDRESFKINLKALIAKSSSPRKRTRTFMKEALEIYDSNVASHETINNKNLKTQEDTKC